MSKDQNITRKLRAILSADVKGYSLLMADDEVATINTLKDYRNIMSECIEQHGGRVVDAVGDNLLAEFESAVDGVQCAVEVQEKLKDKNQNIHKNKRLVFRIGVNIGDVIIDEGRIFGDGVNIAARIEGLADAGGICVSRNAYDHVKNKLELKFDYLGEHEVKNIKEPVRVYKVLLENESSEPLVKESLEMPDKPSIAVLPFNNMSGDPSQAYFSDGLTEQIINGLCKVNDLFVIARNSSFAYRGKSISIKQIAKELGVHYILEGSVQKFGDRVRITAQLIDATTEYHMWSENYDRDLSDIFSLQDEITIKLIGTMEIKLTYGEQARLWDGLNTNIKAYDKFARGVEYFNRLSKKDNTQAQKLFDEAINIDKSSSLFYVMLGFTHWENLLHGWSKSPKKSFEQLELCAEKAFALNDSIDLVHMLLGFVYLLKRQHDKAIKELECAIELNPNGAEAHNLYGMSLIFAGRTELAIKSIKRAFRLNPIPPPNYYSILAVAYRASEQYEKAIELADKCLSLSPDHIAAHLTLAASYSSLNRTEEAHIAAEGVLRIDPNFSVSNYAMTVPYKNKDYLEKYMGQLRKAELPE